MEEVTNKIDKKLKNKQKTRKVTRAILVVLNAALGVYFIYSVTGAITNYIQRFNETDPSSFIRLDGLNENESLSIYQSAISYDENSSTFNVTEATSYSYYGGYLHFKNSNDILKNDGTLNFSSYKKYILRNLSDNREYEKRYEFEVTSSINSGINLFSDTIKEGNYIVYPDNYDEKKPIKIDSEKGIYETIYSPSKNGVRKKIEIRSNNVSPCLVITINDVLQIPSTYCDIAVLSNDEYNENIQNVLKNSEYKVSYFTKSNEKDDLINLYKANSTINVIVDEGDEIIVSSYLQLDDVNMSERYSDGSLMGLDKDVYIRELGGDVFASGRGYASNNDENKWLTPYVDEINNGSLTIRIGDNKLNDLPNILKSLNF